MMSWKIATFFICSILLVGDIGLSARTASAQILSTPAPSSSEQTVSDSSSSGSRSEVAIKGRRLSPSNTTRRDEGPSAEIPRRQILRPIPTGSDYGQQAGRIPARPVQPPTSDDRSLSNVDLLALKVDESLMTGLSQWLAKYNIQLPPTLMSRIEQLELCPDNAKDGLAHYCTKMADGQYHDPWNPWCGYVECEHGSASRMVCMRGTWMGFGIPDITGGAGKHSGGGQPMLITKEDICRKQLQQPIRNKACSALTDYNLCSMGNSMQQSRSI